MCVCVFCTITNPGFSFHPFSNLYSELPLSFYFFVPLTLDLTQSIPNPDLHPDLGV